MAENIKVEIELNATRATEGLARFNKQLLSVDKLFKDAIQSQAEWAANFSTSLANSRQNLSSTAKAMMSLERQRQNAFKQQEKEYTQLFSLAEKLYKGPSLKIKSPIDPKAIPALVELQRQYGLILQKQREADAEAKRIAAAQAAVDKARSAALRSQMSAERSAANEQVKLAQRAEQAEQRRIQKMMALQQKYQNSVVANAKHVGLVERAWKRLGTVIKETYSIKAVGDSIEKVSIPSLGSQVRSAVAFTKESANIASEMLGYRNALQLALGSQEAASAEMQKAISIARDLKLDVSVLMKEYSKFANSLNLAGVGAAKAQRIFEQFAGAARVLNLNAERTSGVFLALEQMVSKGTVSMEELRRQLGDHLPGALNLAAEAMGYGKHEIKKFMDEIKKGNVNSAELVGKLGELVYLRTKDLVPVSLQKYSANLQALNTEITLFKAVLGEIAAEFFFNPLLKALTWLIRQLNDAIGPLRLLGKEVKSISIFANELGTNLDKVVTVTNDIVSPATQLATTYRELHTELTAVNEEVDFSATGMVLLAGVTGTTTGVLAGLLKKIWDISKVGFIALGSGITKIIKSLGGLSKVVAGLAVGLTKLSTLMKFTLAGALAGLVAMGYSIGKSMRSSNDDLQTTAQNIETLGDVISSIKDKGINPDDIITQGTVNVSLRRIQNLREELSKLETARSNLQMQQRAMRQEVEALPDYAIETDKRRGLVELNEKLRQSTEIIVGLRAELIRLGRELENMEASAEAAGTTTMNALDEMFVKAAKKYASADPIRDLREKAMALINLMPDTIPKIDNPLEQIASPHKAAAIERLRIQLEALKNLEAQHQASKTKRSKSVNVYEREANSLSELAIKMQQQLQLLTTEEDQIVVLSAQYEHLARVRKYSDELATGKLNSSTYEKLVQESEGVRDLAIAYKFLANEKKASDALREKGENLIKDAMTNQQKYQAWLAETKKALDEVSASDADRLRVMAKGYEDIMGKAEEASDTMKVYFMEAFKEMEDYFVQFAMTGKFAFDDMVRSILASLARLAVKQAITSFASSFLPSFFAQGGVFTNQVVSKPTMFQFAKGTGLMGEAGPEAIMPLTRLPSGDLGVQAAGGTGGTTNNVSVVINVEKDGTTESTTQQSDEENMRSFGSMLSAKVKQELLQEMRPGGLLNRG